MPTAIVQHDARRGLVLLNTPQPSLRLQQPDDVRVQRLGQPMQDQQRRVLQATLDLTDVCPVDFGLKRKLFLGEVLRSTKAQRLCCQRLLHLLALANGALYANVLWINAEFRQNERLQGPTDKGGVQ